MPSLLSQSEDESDNYLEDFIDSDSDDEIISYHHDPNFNQIEEGDGSNDEPLYGDKEHQVENNYTFIVDLNKVKSEVSEENPDAKISNTPTLQGASSGFTPEGDAPSPLINNDLKILAAQNADADFKSICTPVHVPTKDNLADLFTKILPNGDFIRMRDQLLHPAPE